MAETAQEYVDRTIGAGGYRLRPEYVGMGGPVMAPELQFGDETHRFGLDAEAVLQLEHATSAGIMAIYAALFRARIQGDADAASMLDPWAIIRLGYRSGIRDGRFVHDPDRFIADHIGEDRDKATALAFAIVAARVTGLPK